MNIDFDAEKIARRRNDLIDLMSEGVAIIPTAHQKVRNGNTCFPFRPDSDFYYLTHFPEPDAVIVLDADDTEKRFTLFCHGRDAQQEEWDGKRFGIEGAMSYFAADCAYPIEQLEEKLPGFLENRTKVFTTMGQHAELDRQLIRAVNQIKSRQRSGAHAPIEFIDLAHLLHEMRLHKNADEIKIMKNAAKMTIAGHRRAMRISKPGLYEYQVQAELEYAFKHAGCTSLAYQSIVASGVNACTLHYIDNNDQLVDGELLLIDAGAEYDCYASDITRTFPINGKFSPEQKKLYEVVLAAQKAAIESIAPDRSVNDYHTEALKAICAGLIDLGILRGNIDDVIETGAYRHFYKHRTGHWLGMDVHDVGDYKVDDTWRVLEPGMVVTVEPGLYINTENDIHSRWHNTGIRIEDDILVTRKGNENLTAKLPKEVSDIEALMRS